METRYNLAMISALKQMLQTIESWPLDDQEALAEAAREIEAQRTGVYVMSPEEESAIEEGLAQADRGELASDDEIDAVWRRHGKCGCVTRGERSATSLKS